MARTKMETSHSSESVLKTLILGHSFVRHFKNFIKSRMPEYNFTLKLDPREVMIQYSGKSGATVDSLRLCQLPDVKDLNHSSLFLTLVQTTCLIRPVTQKSLL